MLDSTPFENSEGMFGLKSSIIAIHQWRWLGVVVRALGWNIVGSNRIRAVLGKLACRIKDSCDSASTLVRLVAWTIGLPVSEVQEERKKQGRPVYIPMLVDFLEQKLFAYSEMAVTPMHQGAKAHLKDR